MKADLIHFFSLLIWVYYWFLAIDIDGIDSNSYLVRKCKHRICWCIELLILFKHNRSRNLLLVRLHLLLSSMNHRSWVLVG